MLRSSSSNVSVYGWRVWKKKRPAACVCVCCEMSSLELLLPLRVQGSLALEHFRHIILAKMMTQWLGVSALLLLASLASATMSGNDTPYYYADMVVDDNTTTSGNDTEYGYDDYYYDYEDDHDDVNQEHQADKEAVFTIDTVSVGKLVAPRAHLQEKNTRDIWQSVRRNHHQLERSRWI